MKKGLFWTAIFLAVMVFASCAHGVRGGGDIFIHTVGDTSPFEDGYLFFAYGFRGEIRSGYVRITSFEGTARRVVIPAHIQGMPVVVIGQRAFERRNLSRVIIPPSVRIIEREAFTGNNLSRLTIPPSVTYVGVGAFARNRLTGLSIPAGVTHIGYGAFGSNRLRNVTIGSGITRIEYATFIDNRLRNITIPGGVYYIGRQAFGGNELTNVVLGSNVRIIASQAFDGNQLRRANIPASVTYIGSQAFMNNRLSSVEIGVAPLLASLNAVGLEQTLLGHTVYWREGNAEVIGHIGVRIGEQAFASNDLTSVVMGARVYAIGAGAFSFNPTLRHVTIPSWIYIGGSVFAGSARVRTTSPCIPLTVDIGEGVRFYGQLDPIWAGFGMLYDEMGRSPGVYELRNDRHWHAREIRPMRGPFIPTTATPLPAPSPVAPVVPTTATPPTAPAPIAVAPTTAPAVPVAMAPPPRFSGLVIFPLHYTPVHTGFYTVQVSANRENAVAQRILADVRRDFSNSAIMRFGGVNSEFYRVVIYGVPGWQIAYVAVVLGSAGFSEMYIRR